MNLKSLARPIVWKLSDARTRMSGDLHPPRRLVSQVPGNFKEVGPQYLGYFVEYGGLRSDQRVVDIRCGPGRMAIPLTGFLETGSYDGVDDWSEAIRWCSDNIAPRFSNFHFHELRSPNEKLPLSDESYDFAILGALSRLEKHDFVTYLGEAGRLLKRGGCYFGTCFLLDGTTEAPLPVAFTERELKDTLSGAEIQVSSIHRGSWSGNANALSYQDIIVAYKSA